MITAINRNVIFDRLLQMLYFIEAVIYLLFMQIKSILPTLHKTGYQLDLFLDYQYELFQVLHLEAYRMYVSHWKHDLLSVHEALQSLSPEERMEYHRNQHNSALKRFKKRCTAVYNTITTGKSMTESETTKMNQMMHSSTPDVAVVDVLLIGGGHSHVHIIKMFGMNPVQGIKMTLVSRDVMTPYSGMLPGFVAGHYTHDECHIDLYRLCRFAKVQFIHASVTGLDVKQKVGCIYVYLCIYIYIYIYIYAHEYVCVFIFV